MNETITKGFLAILFGLSLVVHLSSSLASAQCPFGKDEDTNVASKDQHKFSTYQMCVGFTCPQSGLKNSDSVVIGSGIRSLGAFNYLEHQWAQGSFHYGILDAISPETDKNTGTSHPGAYELEAYPLVYKNVPLFGWFHLRLKIIGPRTWKGSNGEFNRDIQWFVTQAQMNSTSKNHKRNHIFGEYFPGSFRGQCRTKGILMDSEVQLSRHSYLPCLSAQNPSPVMSQSFGWNAQVDSKSNRGLTEVHFNWRLNFPLCPIFSRDSVLTDYAILFRSFVQGNGSEGDGANPISANRRGKIALSAPITLKEYVFGGHDPAPPPHASPTCSQSCKENSPEWIQSCSEEKQMHWNSNPSLNDYTLPSTCTSLVEENPTAAGKKRFYGRCDLLNASGTSVHPTPKSGYTCGFGSPYYKSLQSHSDYIRDMRSYQRGLCGNCTRTPQLVNLETTPKTEAAIETTKRPALIHLDVKLQRQRNYQAGVICHGTVMTMATMLSIPGGNYIARYLKETFMHRRLMQVHVWYQFHMQLQCISLLLLIVGWIFASSVSPGLKGAHGLVWMHSILGYFSIIAFILIFITSGIRSSKEQRLNRSISLHSIGGYVCFFSFIIEFALTLPMQSTVSPTSITGRAAFYGPVRSSWIIFGIFSAWTIFVVVCNIESSLLIRRRDKHVHIIGARVWLFRVIPLPAVSFDRDVDLEGTDEILKRGKVFITVSAFAAISVMVIMSWNYFLSLHFVKELK